MALNTEPIRLLILQSTPFCNLNCSYCYLSPMERASRVKMSLQTVRDAARFVRDSGRLGERLTVLWHAGEPLTLPVRYYEESISVLKRELPSTVRTSYNIQTNAVGLNQDWCDLIKRYKICIGVSIDGPTRVHDAMRVTRQGRGSFDLTHRGISTLKKNYIQFGTISVVTQATLERPIETIEFLVGLEPASIGFNVEEIERHRTHSTVSGSDLAIRSFVSVVCDWLDRRGEAWRCREYREVLQAVASGPAGANARRGENKAFSIITVTWDGRVSTFSPELCGYPIPGYGEFIFGSVSEPFSQFENNAALRAAFDSIEAGVRRCHADCDYFLLCGGGAPSNKWQENGTFDSTETSHCRFHKKFFVDEFLRRFKLNDQKS